MSVYVVTGCARGVGLGLTSLLSTNPRTTIIAAVRSASDELSSLAESRPNIKIVLCDMSSENSIKSLSTTLPFVLPPAIKITHIINNAAINSHPELDSLTLTPEALNANITTNVLGPALIVSTLAPLLAQDALIVNITSGIASLELVSNGTISPHITAYSISKAALNMLTVHQAKHLQGKARVVCLDPGHVKTRLGGSEAKVEIEESAGGIKKVIEGLEKGEEAERDRKEGKAKFVNFLGDVVPW